VTPDDEIRLSDLELRMLSLQRAAIDARSREADHERAQRNADLERDLSSYPERRRVYPSSVLELDHITVLDPEPLFPTMRAVAAADGSVSPDAGRTTHADVVCDSKRLLVSLKRPRIYGRQQRWWSTGLMKQLLKPPQ
jgi:hypothetical protein